MDRTCRGETDLIVGVDEDDPSAGEYLGFSNCEVIVKPGMQGRLVQWLNTLAVPAANDYSFLGHIGDDNLPRTVGWDVKIMESLERQGKVGFAFGDDLDPGRPPGTLSIHIFMTSNVVRRLGYMGPPAIQHMYVDPVWFAWGQATSIDFLPDVVLEHLHYTLGKSPADASYEASTGKIPADCTAYNEYCADGLNRDVERLGGTPFSVESLAAFNRSLNIPPRWAA